MRKSLWFSQLCLAGIFLVTLPLLTARPTLAQTVRYVTTTGTNANPASATTWLTATADLVGAIQASNAGDQVWVMVGTYTPIIGGVSQRAYLISLKEGVGIYGGFVGTETAISQRPIISPATGRHSRTIFSGDIGQVGDASDNTYGVVFSSFGQTNATLLDGVVITGGNANQTSTNPLGSATSGGGMSIENASPTLRNCTITGNSAAFFGGGIEARQASPRLFNCVIEGNMAASGGGIAALSGVTFQLTNCIFRGNSATDGGAYFSLSLGNNSGITEDNTLVATNCSFEGNSGVRGGAFGNISPKTNTLFLTNCSFRGNSASQGSVINNSGAFVATLTNCVLWGNGSSVIVNPVPLSLFAQYCLFDASVANYNGTLGITVTTVSPFASLVGTGLRPLSPAIDVGLTTAAGLAGITTDLAGNARFVNSRVDVGAYEFQGVITDYITLKNGLWNDPSVWNLGQVPITGAPVRLRHTITIPAGYVARSSGITYATGARLRYVSGGRLLLGSP